MLIGNEFYGDRKKFTSAVAVEGVNEILAFKTMATQKEQGTYVDPNCECKHWHCANYDHDIKINGDSIDKTIYSTNKKESLTLTYQKDQITEFMKILSLAH
jgi:magnesium-transporting ATPase (P-type)